MNIDDLKDAWGKDEPKDMHLPISTETLGKTRSVVGKLRSKMRAELISLLICYTFIIAVLFWRVRSPLFFNITSVLLFSLLVINGFYFLRFYVFYKSIGRYDLNTTKSIRKILYELELNMEIYRAHGFSAIPLSILTAITLIGSKMNFNQTFNVLASNGSVSLSTMLIVFLTILISFAVTYIFINLHLRLTYGKHLSELKQVMNDLEEDT
jgi:hypothetical protein